MTDPSEEDRTYEWDAEPNIAVPYYPQAPNLGMHRVGHMQWGG